MRSDQLHPGNSYFSLWLDLPEDTPNIRTLKQRVPHLLGMSRLISPSEPQLPIPSPLLFKNSTKIPVEKLSSCAGFRERAQIQAGGGSGAFPIYSAVTGSILPWLTGRAELQGFQRHQCSWETAPGLCGARAGQGQSENNCTGL